MTAKRPTVVVATHTGGDELCALLRSCEVNLLRARSGIEVVGHLFPRGDSYSRPPELMILSAHLPQYSGLSVLAGIRSIGWRTPVILTADPHQEWIWDEARELSCSAILEEPASAGELMALAARILGLAGFPTPPLHRSSTLRN